MPVIRTKINYRQSLSIVFSTHDKHKQWQSELVHKEDKDKV